MKPLFFLLFCAGVLLLPGCTITTEGIQNFEVPIEEIFPPSKTVASYRQIEKPKKISDAELEKLYGGKAKIAILKKWQYVNTLAADYGIPNRPPVAHVSVTELGSKQNAYGAYSNLRPTNLPEANYVKVGVAGTIEETRLIFVQDRYLMLVQDLSKGDEAERRSRLVNFARVISDRIPRDITDIALIGYLPYENRVPATERLDKEDPLGLGVLKSGGVTATYRFENRECKVFLAQAQEREQPKSIMKDVRKAMEKEGEVKTMNLGDEAIQGTLLKSDAMAARHDLIVFGCYGAWTEKEMKELMAAIDRRVKPYVAPPIKEREEDKELRGPEKRGKYGK